MGFFGGKKKGASADPEVPVAVLVDDNPDEEQYARPPAYAPNYVPIILEAQNVTSENPTNDPNAAFHPSSSDYVHYDNNTTAIASTTAGATATGPSTNHGLVAHSSGAGTTTSTRNDPSLNSRNPMGMHQCPHCHVHGSRTKVKTYPNWLTWTSAVALLVIFWPLCWVPLVVDAMKQTDHYCVQCGSYVGSVQPYQDCCVSKRG